eukprot:g5709.t1
MNIESVKKVEIFPQNKSSNSNTWSPKEGTNVLVFNIGAEEKYLKTESLALNFKITLKDSNGDLPDNFNGREIRQDPRIGANAIIDSVVWANQNNNVLEQIHHYNRLCASLLGVEHGFDDFTTHLQQRYGATSSSLASGRLQNRTIQVSMKLHMAMLYSNADNLGLLPLGPNHLNGVRLSIRLANSINANFGAQAVSSNYELSDVSITCEMAIPSGGMLPKMKSIPLLNYSSYFSVVNNGDETINIPTALGSVLSTFSNVVPTEWLNNSTRNESLTTTLLNKDQTNNYTEIAPIRNYDTLLAGLKNPYQFSQDETRNISQDAAGSFANSSYAAMRERYFLNAIEPYNNILHTLAGPLSEDLASNDPDDETNYNDFKASVWGLGCKYNNLGTSDGVSMKGRPFTFRLRSALNGNSPNGIYTFMLHRSLLQLNGGNTVVAE